MYVLWTVWVLPVATVFLITLLTIVACKKFKTSKTTTTQESANNFNDYEGSSTFTDLSQSKMLQDGWQEKPEFTNKDPIYSFIDDATLSVSKASSFASHSSAEPYSVPMTTADLDKESNHYESVGDPVHTSNTAEQCKKKPLRHSESCTSGVDAEGYMEMKAVVQWHLLEISFTFAERKLKLTDLFNK